jgi:hypothetical protein
MHTYNVQLTYLIWHEDIISALLLLSIDYRENIEISRQTKHSPLTLTSSLTNGVLSSSKLDDAIEMKLLNELKQYSKYSKRNLSNYNCHKIKVKV